MPSEIPEATKESSEISNELNAGIVNLNENRQDSRSVFGHWLRQQRMKEDLTQEAVAKRARLSLQHYNKVELGVTGTRRSTVERLAIAVGADVDEAFEKASYTRPASAMLERAIPALKDHSPTATLSPPLVSFDSNKIRGEIQAIASELVTELTRPLLEQIVSTISSVADQYLQKRLLEIWRTMSEDPITGIGNRLAFEQALYGEFSRSLQYKIPMSLVLIDVDRMEDYNQRYGHTEGNKLLIDLAHTLQAQARKFDSIARLTGDEFAIILPHTDAVAATTIARRHRTAVNKANWNTFDPKVTISIGIATTTPRLCIPDELVTNAQRALQKAKTARGTLVTYDSVSKDSAAKADTGRPV